MDAFLAPDVWPMIALAVVWWLLSLSPVWYSTFLALHTRPIIPRRFLFVAVVAALATGIVNFFYFTVSLPLTAFAVYIAPQLESTGDLSTTGRFLAATSEAISDYGLLTVPFVLAASAISLTRYLIVRWPEIVTCLGPNNSFKPKPLRGSA
jgi:hypothetical protein